MPENNQNMNNTQTKDKQKEKIRAVTRGYYDIQKLRIATGNRVVASLRPDIVEPVEGKANMSREERIKEKEKKDKEVQSFLGVLLTEYDKVTDGLAGSLTSRKRIQNSIERLGAEVAYIKSEIDYRLVRTYVDIQKNEEEMLGVVRSEVEKHPMWDMFFSKVGGCGPLMAAVCIANIDIHRARFASSVWKYAGVDVVNEAIEDSEDEDGVPQYKGVGRCRKPSHLEQRTYIDRDGQEKTRVGLTYNPELKSKMCGVLGTCFLRAKESAYKDIYYAYRSRLDNNHKYDDYTNKHKHNMAIRYAVKMFLRDMWKVWRAYEGYDIGVSYEEAYLGRKPHHYNAANDRPGAGDVAV